MEEDDELEETAEEDPTQKRWDSLYQGFQHFVNDFENESDRASVILGAAKIDDILYHILKKSLIPSTTAQDDLLDGDAPLSTFYSKIQMCYRMGLIDAELTSMLNLIRKIRNEFAHMSIGYDLEHSPNRERVNHLVHNYASTPIFEMYRENVSSEINRSVEFKTILGLIIMYLEGITIDIECAISAKHLTFSELCNEMNEGIKKELIEVKTASNSQST